MAEALETYRTHLTSTQKQVDQRFRRTVQTAMDNSNRAMLTGMIRPALLSLQLLAFALPVLRAATPPPRAVSPSNPNVIVILADDLGWADTTPYGHTKYYKTPNIERLAKRGMTFTRAYSASPLCSPTRSAILTGLSPARTGITTPNCHVPEVVLEATPGKAAPPSKT